MQIAISASGMLTKKIARQENTSANHQPSTGPSAAVITENLVHAPIALPRSCASNEALIIARLLGTSSAPLIPCTARGN